MNNLYFPQEVKVKINLRPNEIDSNYEDTIKQKLVDIYGNRCYINGFILKSSIKLIKIENGVREGSHLHGHLTFNVDFSALFCIPTKDTLIPCVIDKINKFGVMARSYPLTVIIPQQLQALHNIELRKDLKEGDYIYVKTLEHTIENSKIVVIGIIMDIGYDSANSVLVPYDGTSYKRLPTHEPIVFGRKEPAPSVKLGFNENLPALRDKIKSLPYTIRQYADKLNMVGIYGTSTTIVKYNNKHIYSKESLYPVNDRVYFVLWEILSETHILDQFVGKSIHIANMIENIGFTQCLIDFRSRQNNTEWKNDNHYLIHESVPNDYLLKIVGSGYRVNLFPRKTYEEDTLVSDLIVCDGTIGAISDINMGLKHLFEQVISVIIHQNIGGVLIMKVNDMYYEQVSDLINLLTIYYGNITIIKPKMVYQMDPDKYLVCTGFIGISDDDIDDMIRRNGLYSTNQKNRMYISHVYSFPENIDSSYLKEIQQFNRYDSMVQIKNISRGLELYEKYWDTSKKTWTVTQPQEEKYCVEWCQKHNIPCGGTLAPPHPPATAP